MPNIEIIIGGRSFEVACQPGEEPYLAAAARTLDVEASVLSEQNGRLPETRLLLMSGLMLADKTVGLEERLKGLEAKLAEASARIEAMETAPRPEPERVEVPVIPASVGESLADLAARAEALASQVEEKLAGT
ncbi:cell division protein ZapA [Rhodovulum sulfidophilum]|uniref:cell division protein ZapA n=1 Tax=Rhodovulum sulfidophilum TaxID=35806 RepID=UPI001389CDD3|nr:cell division protein ZapA [Rhodovulum sulfidophilum]NDK34731.1 cell division protein ZapA [Rhodovulum sulfidophilum]